MMQQRVERWVLLAVWILMSGLPSLHPLVAQDNESKSDAEKWYGVLDLKVQKLRLEIRIREKNGALSGGMVSLDQTTTEFPFDELTKTDQEMSWSIKQLKASFDGKLNAAGDSVIGTFKQGPISVELKLKKVDAIPERKLLQAWRGDMQAGAQKFQFQFRILKEADGEESVVLDSFTENIEGLSCQMTRSGSTVTIAVPATAAKFVGEMNDEENEIQGNWLQNGNKIPLTVKLTESAKKLEVRRPQTPKPPFDYDSEDLNIKNPNADAVLAGTLTTPKGQGPYPLVILISGSGPQDRDETIFDHKPFLVISDHLAKAGFAVFRFDDRGIGESKGNFAMATSQDFASDVEAIVTQLKAHDRIDPERVILAGHSEGGIIAPMVAAQTKVAGLILLAGTGVTGKRISLNQSEEISKLAGLSKPIREAHANVLNRMYDRLEQNEDLGEEFLDELTSSIEGTLPDDTKKLANIEGVVKLSKVQIDNPWFRFFAFHDPAPVLEKVTVPVLVLNGEKDVQVDPDLNLPPIETALEKAGNQDVVVKRFPNLNHLFQECETGSPGEYRTIEQTMSPVVLETMEQWLKERFKK